MPRHSGGAGPAVGRLGGDEGDAGGGGQAAQTSTEQESSTEQARPTTTTDAGGSPNAEGKQVFVANCSGCHTLSDAGANGQVGPNLDDLGPSFETVQRQVTNGGGGMPAFGDQLSEAEIRAVAEYVSQVTGGDAPEEATGTTTEDEGGGDDSGRGRGGRDEESGY